jgi:hypothetical protein
MSEGVDGGAGIGIRVEADAALCANAAPLTGQQGTAEQVGPDRHAIEAPLVPLRPDAGEDRLVREERELDRLSAHDRPSAPRKPWPDTNCRACGFDGHAVWTGGLVCPCCGSRTAVRAAMATEERTDAELVAIATAVPVGEDLAEEG